MDDDVSWPQHVHAFTCKRCLVSWQMVLTDGRNMYMLSPIIDAPCLDRLCCQTVATCSCFHLLRDAWCLDRSCCQTAATCMCFHLPETLGVLTDGVNCQTAWNGRTGSIIGKMILIVSTSFLRSVILILRCAKFAAWSSSLLFRSRRSRVQISARTPVIMTVIFRTPCRQMQWQCLIWDPDRFLSRPFHFIIH